MIYPRLVISQPLPECKGCLIPMRYQVSYDDRHIYVCTSCRERQVIIGKDHVCACREQDYAEAEAELEAGK